MLSQHPLEIPPPLAELVQIENRVALPTVRTHTSRHICAVIAWDLGSWSSPLASKQACIPVYGTSASSEIQERSEVLNMQQVMLARGQMRFEQLSTRDVR